MEPAALGRRARDVLQPQPVSAPQPGGRRRPVENLATLNRAAVDVQLDLRAPVLERTFDSGWLRELARHDVKHTIEPEVTYRYINGINDFPDVLRFDLVDIASNTNEVEYGVTQRLFLRGEGRQAVPCGGRGCGRDRDTGVGRPDCRRRGGPRRSEEPG